eukprot:1145097-Pelagomonas_calceolata.AAC.2
MLHGGNPGYTSTANGVHRNMLKPQLRLRLGDGMLKHFMAASCSDHFLSPTMRTRHNPNCGSLGILYIMFYNKNLISIVPEVKGKKQPPQSFDQPHDLSVEERVHPNRMCMDSPGACGCAVRKSVVGCAHKKYGLPSTQIDVKHAFCLL